MRYYHHSCPFSVATKQQSPPAHRGTSQPGPDPHTAAARLCSRQTCKGPTAMGVEGLFACPKPDTAPRPHALHVAGQEDYKLDKSPSNVCN